MTLVDNLRRLEAVGAIVTNKEGRSNSYQIVEPSDWFKIRTSSKSVPIESVQNPSKPVQNPSKIGTDFELKEDSVNKTQKKTQINSRFTPPLLPEIEAYFAEKKSTASEAGRFFDFYESNGWKVGRNKMQKWHNAASGWISRNGGSNGQVDMVTTDPVVKLVNGWETPEEAAQRERESDERLAEWRRLRQEAGLPAVPTSAERSSKGRQPDRVVPTST